MKTVNFLMLIKASVTQQKARNIVFIIFNAICVICILLTSSVVVRLWTDMDQKVNNHPYNRELLVDVSINNKGAKDKLEAMDGVEGISVSPYDITLTSADNTLNSTVNLSYLHMDYEPVVTKGSQLKSTDKDAVLMPEIYHDKDPQTQMRIDVDCKSFVGKELSFVDENGSQYKLRVAGTYDVTDPALDTQCIYTSCDQLLKYSEKSNDDENESITYSLALAKGTNKQQLIDECEKYGGVAYENSFRIDLSTFNLSLVIMVIVLAVFLVMTIMGLSIFISGCIKNRTNELALYRALGYKTGHIFVIIFLEYLLLLLIAYVIALALSAVCAQLILNPILASMVKGGLFTLTAEGSPVSALIVLGVFVAILAAICLRMTNLTQKIQLAVLLKEK